MRPNIPTPWIRLLPVIAMLTCLAAGTANAQRGPYGYGGGWGAYPYNLNSSYNTSRNIASKQYLASQRDAFQQTARTQSGIRSTLSSEARRTTQGITAQQQGARNWWFKQEQRKMAERKQQSRQMAYRPPIVPVDSAPSTEPRAEYTPEQPAQAGGVTPWPALLQDTRFAATRAKLETLFREWGTPKDPLKPEQYREILDGVGQMKTMLRDMAHEITAAEYLATEKYLDGLVYEARAAVTKDEPAPEKKAKSSPPSSGETTPQK